MAVTVTYAYPVAGTVPPTATQAFNSNMLTCQVNALDADTAITITHNWGLSAAQIANLWPTIKTYLNTSGGTAAPLLTYSIASSVAVVITKVSASGTGGTYTVVLERPHSMIT